MDIGDHGAKSKEMSKEDGKEDQSTVGEVPPGDAQGCKPGGVSKGVKPGEVTKAGPTEAEILQEEEELLKCKDGEDDAVDDDDGDMEEEKQLLKADDEVTTKGGAEKEENLDNVDCSAGGGNTPNGFSGSEYSPAGKDEISDDKFNSCASGDEDGEAMDVDETEDFASKNGQESLVSETKDSSNSASKSGEEILGGEGSADDLASTDLVEKQSAARSASSKDVPSETEQEPEVDSTVDETMNTSSVELPDAGISQEDSSSAQATDDNDPFSICSIQSINSPLKQSKPKSAGDGKLCVKDSEVKTVVKAGLDPLSGTEFLKDDVVSSESFEKNNAVGSEEPSSGGPDEDKDEPMDMTDSNDAVTKVTDENEEPSEELGTDLVSEAGDDPEENSTKDTVDTSEGDKNDSPMPDEDSNTGVVSKKDSSCENTTNDPSSEKTTNESPCEKTTDDSPCEKTTDDSPCEKSTDDPPCEKTTNEPPCEKTTNEPSSEKSTNEPPCEKTTNEPSSEKSTNEPPCEKTTNEPPCEKTTNKPPCEKTTNEPPCEKTTNEPPCEKTTNEPPCEKTTNEPPCEKPTNEPPCEKPTNEPPCEKTTNEPPCEKTTNEPPCEKTTNEPPCEKTTNDPPCEKSTSDRPCEKTTNDPPCEKSTNEDTTETPVNDKPKAASEGERVEKGDLKSSKSSEKPETEKSKGLHADTPAKAVTADSNSVSESAKTGDMVDTSTIKKEPAEESASAAAAAPDSTASEGAQPAKKDQVVGKDPQSKQPSEGVAASADKASESEVKIKEEALSPSSQATENSSQDKSSEPKTSEKPKNDENATQGSESDSAESQKKAASSSSRTCAECGVGKGLRYQVLFQGKTRFLCSDVCFKAFRGKQKLAPPPPSQGSKSNETCGICNRDIKNGQGFFPFSGDSKPVCSEECMVKYQQAHTPKPSCAQCSAPIEGRTKCLTWETMEFCNEDCLGSYQATMGSHCACCKSPVQRLSLGKYCVRFGADIRQFCSGKCLEEFKKGLKVCTFCQKDMSNTAEGFLAPVGEKFRDFCTSECMEQYEALNAATSNRPSVQKCSVCQKVAPVKVQVHHKNKDHVLCSDPCIAAFRYTQKIYASLCDLCHKLFNNEPLCLQIDNTAKKFCTKTCLNLFVLAHRKIVPCTWCKVKKYNFDMIERVDTSNNVQQFCSLNCLSLFRVSLNATSSRCIKCDHCHMNLPAQYHLTMSDASIRNFCSYPCVIKFQGQFTSVPTLTTVTPSLNRQGPTPVGKATSASPSVPAPPPNDTNATSTPVIANVMSLASSGPTPVAVSAAQKTGPTGPGSQNSTTNTSAGATSNGISVMREVHREVIVAPPVPRMLKNKMIMCKPPVQNKGVACKPHPCHKETQTEDCWGTPTLIPIPIPIFVPSPMHMYSRSVPFPLPFPIPVPVPIFIPTTRNTTAKVIKDIFDIQRKVPSNPFEAELLLMAEMVAADHKEAEEDEEEEEESKNELLKEEAKEEKEEKETDLPEPLEDLEVAVPAPPVPIEEPVVHLTPLAPDLVLNENYSEESLQPDEVVKYTAPTNNTSRRGTKRTRGGRGRGGGRGRKRQKIAVDSDTSDEEWLPNVDSFVETVLVTPKQPKGSPSQPKTVTTPVVALTPISSTVQKNTESKAPADGSSPDANLCLKYMFGVNAWKHWVVQKNVQLEKGGSQSRRLKLFKTDILQLSPDELNYSLCLFVKEVRKPNGEEYAPDSIYYLCLGIQMYLYENGRVDNIFTDSYYEKFTECLNDVLIKHDIIGTLIKEVHFVSRIEEEILWESKQLGAHSPQVLLNTLMYFNTKQFFLHSVDDHMQLSFTYIMKGWRKVFNSTSVPKGSRCAVLRYYPPPARGSAESKRGWREDAFAYEQEENFENPLRCPVKLYEFYLSKCPESIRQRNDLFYMCPERSCVPDSPVWYSTASLPKEALVKMLQRISLVREISAPAPSVSSESRANSD